MFCWENMDDKRFRIARPSTLPAVESSETLRWLSQHAWLPLHLYVWMITASLVLWDLSVLPDLDILLQKPMYDSITTFLIYLHGCRIECMKRFYDWIEKFLVHMLHLSSIWTKNIWICPSTVVRWFYPYNWSRPNFESLGWAFSDNPELSTAFDDLVLDDMLQQGPALTPKWPRHCSR